MDSKPLLIFSDTAKSFLKKWKQELVKIIECEMKLTFKRSRFLFQNHFYPVELVIFEHSKLLGFFHPAGFRIGLNKHLMYQTNDQVIKDILRHELAHLMTYILHGGDVSAHGKEFHEVCTRFNWQKQVSKATLNLEQAQTFNHNEKLLNKIQKLLSLASSQNSYESQLATTKANELLLKHNLEDIQSDPDNQTYLVELISAPRNNAKLHAIYEILSHFYIRPVFNHTKHRVYLEAIGPKLNVELALYVAKFLDHELESQWKFSKKENPNLKGLRAKNSFFKGVAKGHIQKIQQSTNLTQNSRSLIVLQQALESHLHRAYPRLSKSYQRNLLDNKALAFGIKKGKDLNIHPGLKDSKSQIPRLLLN